MEDLTLTVIPSTLSLTDISDETVTLEFDIPVAFESSLSDEKTSTIYFGHDGKRLVTTKIIANLQSVFDGNLDEFILLNADDDDLPYTLSEIIVLLAGL